MAGKALPGLMVVALVAMLGWNAYLHREVRDQQQVAAELARSVQQFESSNAGTQETIRSVGRAADDASAIAAATQQRVADLDGQLAQLADDLDALDQVLTNAAGDRRNLADFLVELDQGVFALEREVDGLKGVGYSVSSPSLVELDRELGMLSSRVGQLDESIDDLDCQVRRVLNELQGGWTPVFC